MERWKEGIEAVRREIRTIQSYLDIVELDPLIVISTVLKIRQRSFLHS